MRGTRCTGILLTGLLLSDWLTSTGLSQSTSFPLAPCPCKQLVYMDEFIKAINALPAYGTTTAAVTAYENFIGAFGTHILDYIEYGAKYIVTTVKTVHLLCWITYLHAKDAWTPERMGQTRTYPVSNTVSMSLLCGFLLFLFDSTSRPQTATVWRRKNLMSQVSSTTLGILTCFLLLVGVRSIVPCPCCEEIY